MPDRNGKIARREDYGSEGMVEKLLPDVRRVLMHFLLSDDEKEER